MYVWAATKTEEERRPRAALRVNLMVSSVILKGRYDIGPNDTGSPGVEMEKGMGMRDGGGGKKTRDHNTAQRGRLKFVIPTG